MRFAWLASTLAIALLAGCMATVTVDKRPNLALPIVSQDNKTNDWVIVDQGYEVKYRKWGFSTSIESMSAEITTNKTVNFQLGGLHSIAPTNSISIRLEDLLKIATLFRESTCVGTNDLPIIDAPIGD